MFNIQNSTSKPSVSLKDILKLTSSDLCDGVNAIETQNIPFWWTVDKIDL